jgi:hypothetical protein
MTTAGFNSQVTVHMPSSACTTITANTSVAVPAKSTPRAPRLPQRQAKPSSNASASSASTLAAT